MDVVRDLLDKQLVDRRGRPLGRADSVIIERRAGRPLRVVAIEAGPTAFTRRVHPALASWLGRLLARWGREYALPLRVPIERVYEVGVTVRVDVETLETDALRWEQWWRRHVTMPLLGRRK